MSVILKFPKTCNAWKKGCCKYSDENCHFCHQIFICYSFFYSGECKFGEKCQFSHQQRKEQNYKELNLTIKELKDEVSEKESLIHIQKLEISRLSDLVNQLPASNPSPPSGHEPKESAEAINLVLASASAPLNRKPIATKKETPICMSKPKTLNSVTHPHCGNPVTPSRPKNDFLSLRGILEPINKHQNLQKKIIYGHTRISKRFLEGDFMGL
jgi:hypothetical protein